MNYKDQPQLLVVLQYAVDSFYPLLSRYEGHENQCLRLNLFQLLVLYFLPFYLLLVDR